MVDFKFVDVPGTWQHFSVPLRELTEETFVEGKAFDGSSVRGFQTINESDMLIIPDPNTAIMDPFTAVPTLSLVCNIAHPGPGGHKKPYSRDPRYIAKRLKHIYAQAASLIPATSVPKPNFSFLTMYATTQPPISSMLK